MFTCPLGSIGICLNAKPVLVLDTTPLEECEMNVDFASLKWGYDFSVALDYGVFIIHLTGSFHANFTQPSS